LHDRRIDTTDRRKLKNTNVGWSLLSIGSKFIRGDRYIGREIDGYTYMTVSPCFLINKEGRLKMGN
jgi:hypothetical protein